MKTNNISNCAFLLKNVAQKHPSKNAFIIAPTKNKNKYSYITFQQFEELTNKYAWVFVNSGIKKGTKTIIMVKPGVDLYAVIYGLFKIGAVPVFVDPGMGVKRMLHCLQSTGAEAFIGIPKAHIIRVLMPKFFKSVKINITVGKRLFWGGDELHKSAVNCKSEYSIEKSEKYDLAFINFTTGSTGPAKGVEITQGVFNAVIENIQNHFKLSDSEIELVTLPLLAIIDVAVGITAVLPDMDPTKPAFVDPVKIIDTINYTKATTMFASPALLNRVARYGKVKSKKLPTLNRVIAGGAPVSPEILKHFSVLLRDDAEIHVTYGATESLPISSIESKEMLSLIENEKNYDKGICIGKPVKGLDVDIIKISDTPIHKLSKSDKLPSGQIGEIIIKGSSVTRHYHQLPDADKDSKIIQGKDFWHRMGDCGWIDEKGRIWFCGRKKHRIIIDKKIYFSVPCERIFNLHPKVFRSALVKAGEKPVICVDCEPKTKINKEKLKMELSDLAQKYEITVGITEFLFPKEFPVDIRHNAKIGREELGIWAEKQINTNNIL